MPASVVRGLLWRIKQRVPGPKPENFHFIDVGKTGRMEEIN